MNNQSKFKIVGTREADNAEQIENNEGLLLITVKCATKGRRIAHYLMDAIFYYIFVFIVALLFGIIIVTFGIHFTAETIKTTVPYSIALFCWITYYLFFETYTQRTPGKYITGCLVINEYGEKPSFNSILLRSVIRIIPIEPFSCLSFDGRGWHDTWSNTFVITKKELEEIHALVSVEDIGSLGEYTDSHTSIEGEEA